MLGCFDSKIANSTYGGRYKWGIYISHDPSHIIELDDVQIKENLTYETSPVRIEDRTVKTLRGKEIPLVKVIWGGAFGEDATWELESQMRADYPSLFTSGKFRGRNFF